jgi:hypothetical protein
MIVIESAHLAPDAASIERSIRQRIADPQQRTIVYRP